MRLDHLKSQEQRSTATNVLADHMCKPDLTQAPVATSQEDFERWCACITRFAKSSNIFIKLSGAFSELGPDRISTNSAVDIADRMRPWLDHLFDAFPVNRIMFGSDWPVCNLRGPTEEDSWVVWKDVVQTVLDRRGLSEDDQSLIWSGTATEAYRLKH